MQKNSWRQTDVRRIPNVAKNEDRRDLEPSGEKWERLLCFDKLGNFKADIVEAGGRSLSADV